jgi:hypothetical protein
VGLTALLHSIFIVPSITPLDLGKEFCISCGKEHGLLKYDPKPEWGFKGGKLCGECLNQQTSTKYQGEHIRVIEIPISGTKGAWNKVDESIKDGYTIKGIIEREYWKTSLVILEKQALR